jgi:hypothetical protein
MPEQNMPDSQVKDREPTQQPGISRRGLLRAGLAAAPIFLAVSGRSAMATTTTCATKGLSPMAWNSLAPNGVCGEVSHTVTGHTLGKSPGFWRPNQNGATFQAPKWPVGVVPFETIIKTTDQGQTTTQETLNWNRDLSLSYSGLDWVADGWDSGTKFSTIFTAAADSRSFSRILIADSGNSASTASTSLNWFFCAAYLNALAYPSDYAMSASEVVRIYNQRTLISGGKNPLSDSDLIAFLTQTWA